MIYPALSLKPPWTWAILNGKNIENRSWRCPKLFMNRTILMHASRSWDWSGYDWLFENRKRLFNVDMIPTKDKFNFGGIVGSFEITSCVKDHPSPFFFGEYGYVLEKIKPLPFYPCRGYLKFFDVDYPEALVNYASSGGATKG